MLVVRPLGGKARVTASCLTTDAVGDLVYVAGSIAGNDYDVAKVDVGDYTKMPAFGVIVAKLSTTRCVVQMSGEVVGIYTGLTEGRVYFAGSDGRPSLTPPAPGLSGRAYLQSVGLAVSADVLKIEPINDMKVRT